MEILTNVKDILQMARDERCSGYTAELLVKDLNELIALREAGNKLARVAKDYESIDDLLDAIGEWEAANK